MPPSFRAPCLYKVVQAPQHALHNLQPTARVQSQLLCRRRISSQQTTIHAGSRTLRKSPAPSYVVLAAVAISLGFYNRSLQRRPVRLDSSREPLTTATKVEVTGKDHSGNVDQVATGTSKVPLFPRTIWLPRSGGAAIEGKSAALPAGIGPAREEEEYQLLGLGIRTVSFLSIQVYVVGIYVAKNDLGRLQRELINASVPEGSAASTLVQGEKDDLRKRLLDGAESEKIWGKILKDGDIRSAVRVVPTRATNLNHLRDGWIRGIDLRGKGPDYENVDFKATVDTFKGLMGGRGSVAVGKIVLLGRGAKGDLRIWLEDGATSSAEAGKPNPVATQDKMSLLGRIEDKRLSTLVWMGYLAGSKVASEPARQSVVEGVMEVVERPSGTLETQVV